MDVKFIAVALSAEKSLRSMFGIDCNPAGRLCNELAMTLYGHRRRLSQPTQLIDQAKGLSGGSFYGGQKWRIFRHSGADDKHASSKKGNGSFMNARTKKPTIEGGLFNTSK